MGPVVERAGRPGAWLFGGELDLKVRWGAFITPLVQLCAESGTGGSDTLPVRVTSGSGAAYLLLGTGIAAWRWGVGPGARAGVAWLSGEASGAPQLRGDTLRAPWAGLGLRAEIGRQLAAPMRASLGADAGIITLRAAGTLDDKRRVFALDGAWVGLTLTAGVDF